MIGRRLHFSRLHNRSARAAFIGFGKCVSNKLIVIFSKMTLLAALLINTKMETVLMRGGLLAFSGDDSFSIRAIPHKERTAKRSEKRYNKEVKKQLTRSLISDELGQASTKKSSVIRKLIPSKRATSGTSATRSTSAWMRTADWFTRWKQ